MKFIIDTDWSEWEQWLSEQRTKRKDIVLKNFCLPLELIETRYQYDHGYYTVKDVHAIYDERWYDVLGHESPWSCT